MTIDDDRARRVLVFDSGLGGLTVYKEIVAARPDLDLAYAADDAGFPYGALGEGALVARVEAVLSDLIADLRPDVVVIACNTASTLVLPPLRARYRSLKFVGTVPAIKPAARASRSRLISVLATPGTVSRDYTRGLVRDFAGDCDVELVGSGRLAALAERRLRGEYVENSEILAEIAPCFVSRGERRTDKVVLACTHFPLLIDLFVRLAPWPVDFVDPAPAIARRVDSLVGPAPARAGRIAKGLRPAIFTRGGPPSTAVQQALIRLGLDASSAPVRLVEA